MPKQKPNEQVQQIPLSEIRPFKNHPFKVTDDELMQQTIDSIMQVGVLNPAIIRPAPEGGYEMVAGHRRLHAADLAGLKTIPAIVRNLDDDEAVILMVDSKEIAFSPAVELSYLTHDEQKQFLDAMDYSQNTPSLSQAQRLKKLSREGKCTQEAMRSIMSEEKKEEQERITLSSDTLRKYFPRSYTPLQMQQTIIKLLEQWQKKQQRRNER